MSMTQKGIKPVAFRFAAQCLDQLLHRLLRPPFQLHKRCEFLKCLVNINCFHEELHTMVILVGTDKLHYSCLHISVRQQ